MLTKTQHILKSVLPVITAGLLLAFQGCSGRNGVSIDGMTQSMKETLHLTEKKLPPIHRIEPIWKAAKGSDTNGFPARGAAGQILFFTAGSELPTPLKGEGRVIVYIFHDQGTKAEQTTPIHKFTFSLEAWNAFLIDDSSLGPSYHVFIPYPRKNIYQTMMSLVVQLRGADGRVLAMSNPANVVLPGPTANKNEETVNLVPPVITRNKTNVTTVLQSGEPVNQTSGTARRSLMGDDGPSRSRDLLDPQSERDPFDRRDPIRQMSGVRHPFAETGARQTGPQTPTQRAADLLDHDPEIRRLMNDYRNRTGHSIRQPSPDIIGDKQEEPGVMPGRGFRLGGSPRRSTAFDQNNNAPRSFNNSNVQPDRDPFAQNRHSEPNHGFDNSRNQHPLTTAGFTSTPQPREVVRRQQQPSHPFHRDGHPLGGSFGEPEDGYTRPSFAAPQPRRTTHEILNQPSADDLLDGNAGSPNWQRKPANYRPVIDERRAWSNE